MEEVKKYHLTKAERRPRCYREAEKILKSVRSCQGNLSTLMQNSKLLDRRDFSRKVYALVMNVLKYNQLLKNILLEVRLLEKEPLLRREFAEILVYELTLGSRYLPGKNKAVLTVLKYEREILQAFKRLDAAGENQWSVGIQSLPRYARVNTLLSTVPLVLAELVECGYQEVKVSDNISEEGFMERVRNLTRGSFLVDYHFKDLLVFASGENLLNLALYQKGHILLQDKASYLPVQVLNPEPGSVVLDACAAPGMKAVHLAAKMQNIGILYAYDRSKNRFKDLNQIFHCAGVTIGRTFCQDFMSLNPCDPQNSDIRYILVDPSCSGSGMVKRMDSVTDTPDSKNEARLKKLAGFQVILLKHALKFPSAQKVVYSTCSINEEENEYVVHEALNAFRDQFRLAKIEMDWSLRGFESYKYGNFCLRCIPEKNLTNGFFVALFERLENNLECNAYKERRRPNNKLSSNILESVADASFNKKSRVNKRDYNTDSESKSLSRHGSYDKEFVDVREDISDKLIMSTKETKKRKKVDSVLCSYGTFKREKNVPMEFSNLDNVKNAGEFLSLEDKLQFVHTANDNIDEDVELHKKHKKYKK